MLRLPHWSCGILLTLVLASAAVAAPPAPSGGPPQDAAYTVKPGDTLVVWEAFKIYGGKIHAVEAFMKNMPQGTLSGWDSARGN